MKRFVVGSDRDQTFLLPPSLEDYVDEDNPVRVVDAFTDELDLRELGFSGVDPKDTGRPAYHPAVMLKIYIYGYLNQVQSSRRLEREAGRNLELMWLTGHLVPDFKTIANFRKDNGPAIQSVCSQFVGLCRELGLLGILFSRLDMEAFQRCFIAWVASLHETPEGVVAIDGKTLRRSFDTRSPEAPIHMISAWPCDHQLVPGQRKIDDRSNEITAIPELLALLALKGAIVTIDAIGCQRKICQQIMDQEAGYVIGLKGNQGSLREDVELFFDEHPERDTGAKFIEKSEAADAGHGRIETRCCTVCSNTEPNATNGRA